jgi:hypothetical protein
MSRLTAVFAFIVASPSFGSCEFLPRFRRRSSAKLTVGHLELCLLPKGRRKPDYRPVSVRRNTRLYLGGRLAHWGFREIADRCNYTEKCYI